MMKLMNTPRRLRIAALAASLILAPAGAFAEPDAEGFVPLFDGRTLAGWTNPYRSGEAQVVEGEIHLTNDRKFVLVTEKTYSDFIFEGEVLLPEGPANSGFFFRAQVQPDKVYGYQAEVDGDPNRKWSGGLYDEARRLWFISPHKDQPESVKAFRARAGDAFKRNEWNSYRITCEGRRLRIEVNGVLTTDVEDEVDASGVIGIQHHGEKGATYRFRKLRIKELK
jgi:hypothetical protein